LPQWLLAFQHLYLAFQTHLSSFLLHLYGQWHTGPWLGSAKRRSRRWEVADADALAVADEWLPLALAAALAEALASLPVAVASALATAEAQE